MLQTLPVTITQADPRPLHRQIYDQIRDLILSGRLAPGIRLPSIAQSRPGPRRLPQYGDRRI